MKLPDRVPFNDPVTVCAHCRGRRVGDSRTDRGRVVSLTTRLVRCLLTDTDRPALLAMQSMLVLTGGAYLLAKDYAVHGCSWPCERSDWGT